jgi:hypothetical protein
MAALKLEECPLWVRDNVVLFPQLITEDAAKKAKLEKGRKGGIDYPVHNTFQEKDTNGYCIGGSSSSTRNMNAIDVSSNLHRDTMAALRCKGFHRIMRCEGGSYLISQKAKAAEGGSTKEPALQDGHQDFQPARIRNMEKKLGHPISTMTLLLTLDPMGSVVVYPPVHLRETERPVRIMLHSAGDAAGLFNNIWHGGDIYKPPRTNMKHLRAHWYMIDYRWPRDLRPAHHTANGDVALHGARAMLLSPVVVPQDGLQEGVDERLQQLLPPRSEEEEEKVSKHKCRKMELSKFVVEDNAVESESD